MIVPQGWVMQTTLPMVIKEAGSPLHWSLLRRKM